MSIVAETIQDAFDFSSLPLYLRDQILEKMNHKSYTTFMQTGKMAAALDKRNNKNLYPMEVNRIVIEKNSVYIEENGKNFCLPFEKCEKMKFKDLHVTIRPDFKKNKISCYFTKNACDFLLKLGEINTLECLFLEGNDAKMAEVFKKVKIQKLKMEAGLVLKVIYQFHYDTSNVYEIEIDNCLNIPFRTLSSIKAQKTVALNEFCLSNEDIFGYIEKIANQAGKVTDLTFYRVMVNDFDQVEEFLRLQGGQMEGNTWNLTRSGEEKPYLSIEIVEDCMFFRQC